MDDALAFPASPTTQALLARLETKLVARAALVLCSSSRLRDLLISRNDGVIQSKLAVVRNAISSRMLEKTFPLTETPGGRVRIAYFGTIAEWLDFDALLAAVNRNRLVEFHLVGPKSNVAIPHHERLRIHRPVRHEDLVPLAKQFDAFIMPFRISELTAAVDPVKLYEYLAFEKEIISVRYDEIDRFSPFVHFYRTLPEFLELVDRVTMKSIAPKNIGPDRSAFLQDNTWEARCAQIRQLLTNEGVAV